MELREVMTRLRALAMIAKDKEQVTVSPDTVRALEDAVRFINRERWVSVDEKYPDNDRYILLSFENFTVPQVGRYEDNNFFVGDETEPLIKQDLYVNAWKEIEVYEE